MFKLRKGKAGKKPTMIWFIWTWLFVSRSLNSFAETYIGKIRTRWIVCFLIFFSPNRSLQEHSCHGLELLQALRVVSVEGFEFRRFSQAWRSSARRKFTNKPRFLKWKDVEWHRMTGLSSQKEMSGRKLRKPWGAGQILLKTTPEVGVLVLWRHCILCEEVKSQRRSSN